MNRRDLVSAGIAGLGLSALGVGSRALAQGMDPSMPMPAKRNQKYDALTDAAADCLKACERCIIHCQGMLASGDKMMADCLKKCLELVPLCEATETLGNYSSQYVEQIAKICAEACAACAKSCKPHITHHEVCKVCYEACLKCLDECKKI